MRSQTMNTISTSLLVAACIFAGGMGGLYLHRVLPRQHLTRDTLDVIKLGTGMLSVLASLVLGLLIATAKTSHDSADLAVRNYAAELALLNEALRDYGGPASVSPAARVYRGVRAARLAAGRQTPTDRRGR